MIKTRAHRTARETQGSGARRRGARGMTLIEILVVLMIVAGLMGAGISMMGALTKSQLREEAMRLTSVIKYAYNQAALNNTQYRLVLNLETGEYFTEMTEAPVVAEQPDEDAFAEGLLPEEARELEEQHRQNKRSLFDKSEDDPFGISQRVGYERAEEAVVKLTELRNGVSFESVRLAGREQPLTQGRAALRFFPNGFQQEAVVVLRDDEGSRISLVTEPLTGRVKIYSGDWEPDRDFGEEERDD
ncbi:type II secretion system protein [Lujinxingia vulgaris]|uniref:Type II secretion system protein n=2 Tax=Lujinxingia vulgaris TaxID=2600176 RepID=A0A5C6X8K8_9DELT|nr:type II secretion system protein [Lujinxingia vulgaris]